MNIAEKFTSLMERPGAQNVNKDDVPWWMRYAGRGLGSVAGFFAILFGLWNCVFIFFANVDALLSGLWQVVGGFIILCCEAPCCCLFIEHVQRFSAFVEAKPYWYKAVGYVAIAIPAIVICPGLASFFGSGLILGTGVIYGMMALGKKASAEEMRQAAAEVEAKRPPTQQQPQQQQPPPSAFSGTLNDGFSSSMQANLVANAHPISFTGSLLYDSNV